MTSKWIHEVWSKSCNENVLATNSQFDIYIAPPFYNLNLTSTGLSEKKKEWVKKAVENRGGLFHGGFDSNTIDVLIAEKDSIEKPKVQAALKTNKKIVSIEWIVESVKKGYALPIEKYLIHFTATINETAMSNLTISPDLSITRKRKSNEMPEAAFDELNVSEAKKAGRFLDGFNVSYQFI